jgi:hypothetical protein
VTIDAAGLYDIGLPFGDFCDCAFVFDDAGAPIKYLMSLHFVNVFTTSLITDEFPLGCYSWNNWGSGWYDLVNDAGFPGELIIYGDVECCDLPVGAEKSTWGNMKQIFR